MYCECCLQRLSGAVCGAHVWDDRRPAWRLSQVVHVARLPVSARRRGIGLELQIWSRPFCLVGVLWRRARSPSDVFTRRAPLLTAVDRCRRLWDEGGVGGGGGRGESQSARDLYRCPCSANPRLRLTSKLDARRDVQCVQRFTFSATSR